MEVWRWWNKESGEVYYLHSREEGEKLTALCCNEWPRAMEHVIIDLVPVVVMTAEEAFEEALEW